MRKIKSSLNARLIIIFLFKAIVTGAAVSALLSALCALIIFKTDISFEYSKYISIAICAAAACACSYICAKGFKNNGFLIGAVSVAPMLIFSLINMIISSTEFYIFAIKLVLCIACAGLCGAAAVKNSKKIRVKK